MNITKHALERMIERGMTPEMMANMMKGRIIAKPSRNGTFAVVGRSDGNFWTVLLGSDMYTVITVRRAHPDEEVLWKSSK